MSARSSTRIELAVAAALLVSLAACKRSEGPSEKSPLKVAAAADLAIAFGELGKEFEKTFGERVVFSFGSTGLLAKQIQEGGPYDVFAAANVSFVDELIKTGRCQAGTKSLYSRGRIVIWTPDGKKLAPPASVADLADERFTKIAIANPEHAPYGQAAKEALEKAGVWEQVKPKLVFGENVLQTMQFAQSGNVEAAIVALSLSIVAKGGHATPIDEKEYAPIDQAMVICAPPDRIHSAIRFDSFVRSDGGRTIMRRYGFLLPGETLVAQP